MSDGDAQGSELYSLLIARAEVEGLKRLVAERPELLDARTAPGYR